ncbi:MAG: metal ABC transporter ATP-binding protein [Rhizobiales bacterium]|nr:metal ABC transporter ATP-binding protein [Hyphomicrobiales bacterium]
MDAVSGRKPEILVSLEGAGARQLGHWLVRGVDLSVRRGEIVTLIGPNGSGKTTSAKLAIGLLDPTEGTVRREDNLKIGYVPQKLTTDHTLPLTVGRLMTLGARQEGAAVIEALEAVGIAELADAQVRHLSGGEFQRALVARALIRKPDLLVLDEPVQGVDFTGELALYDLIQTIRSDLGCGILLISHDLHVVMAQTDTVVCLNGHVCCTGSPEAVASNPEYEKLFGRRAVEALAVYRHHHDHVHLPDGRIRHDDGSITDAEEAAHPGHEETGSGGHHHA